MDRTLRIGVIGAGHFGRFHALKVAANRRATLVGLHDPDPVRGAAIAAEAGTHAMDVLTVLRTADAVIIAAPAAHHHALGMAALRAGRHVLMEKPIAATLAEADELADAAHRAGLVLQVGHLERFSAVFEALTAKPGQPLFMEATRVAPFKPRGTDVSVVLDLMIHDLDLLLTLAGASLASVSAVGAPVLSAHDDMANARLTFANGVVATVIASRVSPRTERRLRIYTADAYLTLDFAARRLTRVARGHGTVIDTLPGFGAESTGWHDHDALAAEHDSFVKAVLDGAVVRVDAAAGRAALDAALRVEQAIHASREHAAACGILRV